LRKKPAQHEITQLLAEWREGNQSALDELYPLVYDELHRLARRYMSRERAGHTLQTTALINEAYVRLVDQKNVQWANRSHFFAISAQVMRHILVDHVRARGAGKRGAGAEVVSLDEALTVPAPENLDLAALDDSLTRLGELDLRKMRIVELRYFGGLSIEETAEAMACSPTTVKREWTMAKAWLFRDLTT